MQQQHSFRSLASPYHFSREVARRTAEDLTHRRHAGNGGVFSALGKSGMITFLETAGVHYIQVHSVDNAVALAPDPAFAGFAVQSRAEVRSLFFLQYVF